MTAAASTSGLTGVMASSAHHDGGRGDGPLAAAVGDAVAGYVNRLHECAVTLLAGLADGWRPR